MSHSNPASLSESVQMYLIAVARLRDGHDPVPLASLAHNLDHNAASVNEMCRRLHGQGLVTYRPYEGVTLTPEGEKRAQTILRRHMLWEVLLVEKLGLDPEQAHEEACRLEHATSASVAERLDAALGYPTVSPTGLPIPRSDDEQPPQVTVPLSEFSSGQRGVITACNLPEGASAFAREQGLWPGTALTVMAVAEESLLLFVKGRHVSIARGLAEAVEVQVDIPRISVAEESEEKAMKAEQRLTVKKERLHNLVRGQRGTVVQVDGRGPARQRMMDMGLVPGAEVKIVRVAPLGDPIEFQVKGYNLSLRRSEAKNITVELAGEEA